MATLTGDLLRGLHTVLEDTAAQNGGQLLLNSDLWGAAGSGIDELFAQKLGVASFTITSPQIRLEDNRYRLLVNGRLSNTTIDITAVFTAEQDQLALQLTCQSAQAADLVSQFPTLSSDLFNLSDLAQTETEATITVAGFKSLSLTAYNHAIVATCTPDIGPTAWLTLAPALIGQSSFDNEPVALSVAFPTAKTGWVIGVPAGLTGNMATLDLLSPGQSDSALALLPTAVQAIDSLSILDVSLQLTPAYSTFDVLEFVVSHAGAQNNVPIWQVVPGVALIEITVSLEINRNEQSEVQLAGSGWIQGEFLLSQQNPFPLIVQIPIPLTEGTVSLSALPNLSLSEAIEDVVSLVTNQTATTAHLLPTNSLTTALSSFTLTYLSLSATLSPVALTETEFVVEMVNPWTIIADRLQIAGIRLRLNIDHPGTAEQRLVAAISGQFLIGDEAVFLSVQHYDPKADWQLNVISRVIRLPSLSQLAGLIGPELQTVTNLLPASLVQKQFSLNDLAIQANLSQAQLQRISFALRSVDLVEDDPWAAMPGLLGDNIALTNFVVQLDLDWRSGSLIFSGLISGSLRIGQTAVILTASHPASPDAGWLFAGSSAYIAIGDLLTDIADWFGVGPLPDFLQSLILTNTAIQFNSKNYDFSFTCTGQLTLDQVELAATIQIELNHQADNSYRKHFAGHVLVNNLPFDLVFDEQTIADGSQTRILLGAFRNPAGETVSIDELLNAVLASQIQTGLSFTLKEALLAHYVRQNPPQAAEAKWLFGLAIEGGLDLTQINLPGLPFLQAELTAEQTLKLAFLILAPSANFSEEELKQVDGLVTGGLGLPVTALAPPVALETTLQLGAESKQLNLPIVLDTAVTPDSNGLAGTTDTAVGQSSQNNGISSDGTRWVNIQKSFGPIHIARLGLKFDTDSGEIEGQLDAALAVGGLTVSLDRLTVASALSPLQPRFDLHGLGIDYRNDPLEIGGAFLKQQKTVDNALVTEFAGTAVIRTEAFSLAAIGIFGMVQEQPSFFIYTVLNYPLGGPAFFFVTGLAGGFGYNRQLIPPSIDQVSTFPLVLEATKAAGPAPLPTSPQAQQQTLSAQLEALDSHVETAVGQNFLAVGIKFTSFKIVSSFALLIVQFGQRFEIDLLGLSTLTAPPEIGSGVTPVAEAQLALRGVFIPDEGFLGIQAQLTSNSYILSRDCRLTGGFAFFCWFKGPHQGDFVLSLGGYHPAFHVPDHYPRVPRLGFNWRVSTNLTLKGQLYFALTAHALMAGGGLEAIWRSDNILVTFIAGADFLIAWQPYYYDISLFVSMTVQVTIHFWGTHQFSLGAGANLHLWGPEFSGQAHAYVKVLGFKISFDVAFGGQATRPKAINWTSFEKAFLLEPPTNGSVDTAKICSVIVQDGLIRQETVSVDNQPVENWVMYAKKLALLTQSTIPITQTGNFSSDGMSTANTSLAVQPMGLRAPQAGETHTISSTHTITITRGEQDVTAEFEMDPIFKSFPVALWGQPTVVELYGSYYVEPPALNGQRFVHNLVAGFVIRPKIKAAVDKTPEELAAEPKSQIVEPTMLAYETSLVPDAFSYLDFTLDSPIGAEAWQAAAETAVNNPNRTTLLNALGLDPAFIDMGQPVAEGVLL